MDWARREVASRLVLLLLQTERRIRVRPLASTIYFHSASLHIGVING